MARLSREFREGLISHCENWPIYVSTSYSSENFKDIEANDIFFFYLLLKIDTFINFVRKIFWLLVKVSFFSALIELILT